MTRIFVAAYPSQEAIEDLDTFLERRREHGEFRWVPADQIHLTLAFLADVPDRIQDDLADRLGRAANKRHAMTASMFGGGAFPSVGHAKVLWAGLQVEDSDELRRLAIGVRSAAAKAGSAPSGERFKPHLTVARLGRPIEATKWVRLLDSYRGPAWRLDHIALVASYLGGGPRKRPRHEVTETFRLG